MLTIDFARYPALRLRIDSFSVPDRARAAFLTAVQRSQAFVQNQPGFLGQVLLEKTGGRTRFDVVTIAAWDSDESLTRATAAAQAYYQQVGFDPRAFTATNDIVAELGEYGAEFAER